jgi:hypothetical protein
MTPKRIAAIAVIGIRRNRQQGRQHDNDKPDRAGHPKEMPPERFAATAIIGTDLNHFFAFQIFPQI